MVKSLEHKYNTTTINGDDYIDIPVYRWEVGDRLLRVRDKNNKSAATVLLEIEHIGRYFDMDADCMLYAITFKNDGGGQWYFPEASYGWILN